MGILDRFTTIVKANINELLDKAEDPAKMVDQYLVDLTESLADVKRETAGVMAEEARTKRAADANAEEVSRMEDLAKKALKAGNEGDARVFLAKKQKLETAGAELQKAADAAKANADKMRQMHDKLVSDIEDLKSRRETIKAKMAVAKTQEKVAGYTSAPSRRSIAWRRRPTGCSTRPMRWPSSTPSLSMTLRASPRSTRARPTAPPSTTSSPASRPRWASSPTKATRATGVRFIWHAKRACQINPTPVAHAK